MTAGRQSAAHLSIELKTRLMPMSLGFSRPRIARCFITLTNSLQWSHYSTLTNSPRQTSIFDAPKIPHNKNHYSSLPNSSQRKKVTQRSQNPHNKNQKIITQRFQFFATKKGNSTLTKSPQQKSLLNAPKFFATKKRLLNAHKIPTTKIITQRSQILRNKKKGYSTLTKSPQKNQFLNDHHSQQQKSLFISHKSHKNLITIAINHLLIIVKHFLVGSY